MASIAKLSASCIHRFHTLLIWQSSKEMQKLQLMQLFQIPSSVKYLHLPSRPEIPSQEHGGYEISKCPNEWKFVEQILPPKSVPEPLIKQEYPSGWKPAKGVNPELPYFIERNKNHMPSVYLVKTLRGQRTRTKIRKIIGDIWALEGDLKSYLKEKHNRDVLSQVHEVTSCIWLKGDYVTDVQEWMLQKGF